METRPRPIRVHIALLACVLGIIGSVLWWQHDAKQKKELYLLYTYACADQRDSFERLSKITSSAATRRLQQMAIAREQDCVASMRVAAIKELVRRGLSDGHELHSLLKIDQPFVIRHVVAEAFAQHGCDRECLATTLESLHAISQGQATLEMRLQPELEGYLKDLEAIRKSRQDLQNLQQETTTDYFRLLSSDPRATRQILRSDYSADDQFIRYIEKSLPAS